LHDRMRDRGATYLLLAPAGVIFGTLFVLPLTYFLVISFWRVELFKLKPDFTFANYLQVFELHLPTLLFTLGLALVIAMLTTSLGFVYAYLIRFKAGRWGPTLLFIALVTLFGGYLMKIYSWMTILGITGVLNSALRALGIIDEPLPWLFYNVGAVVVTLVNFLLPLAILPIYASMRGITDIEMEAARDLGAGGWRRFSDIVVPRSHTGIMAGFALCFLLAAGDYLTPQLVGGKVNMIGVQIASQFGGLGNWPMGSAMSFITLGSSLAIILLFIFLLAQWRPR
jgi:spermidine/putrescine transport system permease protein